MQETPSSIPGLGRSAGEGIGYPLQYSWASLVAQLVKIHQQCGRLGFSPWVGKIPWWRERLPTPVFWPGEFHGLCRVHGVTKNQTGLNDFHFHAFRNQTRAMLKSYLLTKGEARRYVTGVYNPIEFCCQGFTAIAKFRRLLDYSSFREPGTCSHQER